MTEAKKQRSPIETGAPDGFQYMHPTMRKNFGQWKWHDHPKPGVLRHKAESGEEIWTVRAGTQRILDVFTLRTLCDIGDKYADGYVRFTIRSNIEYMVKDAEKVENQFRRGIITDGDLRRLISKGMDIRTALVNQIMTKGAQIISSNSLASEAAHLMEKNRINHLLVVQENKLIGAIGIHDLLEAKII